MPRAVTRKPVEYPAKKPNADIAANVLSGSVFQAAMLKLQRFKTDAHGQGTYYFTKKDLLAAQKTMRGEGKYALDNMLRWFDGQPKKTTTVERDTLMRFIGHDATDQFRAVAGADGAITGKEADKLPTYLRDDFKFITTGKP